MAKVIAYKDESLESLIRRFKKKIEREDLLIEMRKKDFYKSPSLKKREKHENALKRAAKFARKNQKNEDSVKKGK